MNRNIGFDFGTHQTKVCVEEKEGNYKKYSFVSFLDRAGETKYTLPTIINVDEVGRLHYGYIKPNAEGRVVRYFKQATFAPGNMVWNDPVNPEYYTIWYMAYLLFDLIDRYDFDTITMGVPTDSSRAKNCKQNAVSLLSSAFKLVDEVFEGDKDRFLDCDVIELSNLTEIVSYSDNLKNANGILVFPEAYACLMPLLANGRLKDCSMNLMVDIGGGTTDISFFTLEANKVKPIIYHYASIPMGVNFLTDFSVRMEDSDFLSQASIINESKLPTYNKALAKEYQFLLNVLKRRFLDCPGTKIDMLERSLNGRPIVFTGGGSVFEKLCTPYSYFSDMRKVSSKDWALECVERITHMDELCPILSTAYGLSISMTDDEIQIGTFDTLFSNFKRNWNNEQTSSAITSTCVNLNKANPGILQENQINEIEAIKNREDVDKLIQVYRRREMKIPEDILERSFGIELLYYSDEKLKYQQLYRYLEKEITLYNREFDDIERRKRWNLEREEENPIPTCLLHSTTYEKRRQQSKFGSPKKEAAPKQDLEIKEIRDVGRFLSKYRNKNIPVPEETMSAIYEKIERPYLSRYFMMQCTIHNKSFESNKKHKKAGRRKRN